MKRNVKKTKTEFVIKAQRNKYFKFKWLKQSLQFKGSAKKDF